MSVFNSVSNLDESRRSTSHDIGVQACQSKYLFWKSNANRHSVKQYDDIQHGYESKRLNKGIYNERIEHKENQMENNHEKDYKNSNIERVTSTQRARFNREIEKASLSQLKKPDAFYGLHQRHLTQAIGNEHFPEKNVLSNAGYMMSNQLHNKDHHDTSFRKMNIDKMYILIALNNK